MATATKPKAGTATDAPAPGATDENPLEGIGSNAENVALTSNPSTDQVTQAGGDLEAPAEGQRIRDAVTKQGDGKEYVTIDQVTYNDDPLALRYDETGQLVTGDGKKVALAADASDPDVGWTVQHAHSSRGDDAIAYPGGPNETPDQTFHPDELPDPVSAVRAGLLPQNVSVLNIDPDKFAGKKSLEA